MIIPGFKLGRMYSDGAFCKGYNALNLSNHKTVNIHVFSHSLLANQTFSSQFREITRKLAGKRYGIMTPILQAEISEHECYVISEYFPSTQQPPSPPPGLTRDRFLQIALQLAQTLDQLHEAGLVHGGIEYSALHFKSPDRLMLRPVNLQRTLPMLYPSSLKSLEQSQKIYLAPEAGDGLTPATDYYALGVLLYQLIFGLHADVTDSSGQPVERSFVGEYRNLGPFFLQLLAVNASYRIQNLDQFKAGLVLCGISIPDNAHASIDTGPIQRHKTRVRKPSAAKFIKGIIPAVGLAVTALAGIRILTSPQEPLPQPVKQPVISQFSDEETAKPQPDGPFPVLENLYQQALSQTETTPNAALATINVLLKQKPDDLEAIKLKQRIEQTISIHSILSTAERQFTESKLLQPNGDNAFESYQMLAKKLPADDERVGNGFTRIAAAFHEQAVALLKKNLLEDAMEAIERGLSVRADYSPLLELRIKIDARRKSLRQEARLAAKEQQRLTGELMRRQDEEALKAEQLTKQKVVEEPNQAKIDTLLRSANDHLSNNTLSLHEVLSAHMEYEELIKLDSANQDINRLQDDLIEAYTMLAIRDNNDKLYELAIQSLEQGAQMPPHDLKKLQIRSQLIR